MKDAIIRPAAELSEDWMVIVFLCSFVILAWTRARHSTRLSYILHAAFNVRLMRQVIREEPNVPLEYRLLSANFIILIALLVYLVIKFFHITPPGWSGVGLYLSLAALFTGTYVIKSACIYFVRFLAQGDFGLSEYRYNVSLINRLSGLFLLPITIGVAYSGLQYVPVLLAAGFGLFAISVLYRLSRGVLNAIGSGVKLFYIFFYICTLEILPLVVFYRIITF